MTDPRYPIGKYEWKGFATHADRLKAVEAIAETPAKLRAAVKGLTDKQLDTPYRDGGWSVRQVVHHIADSHMNAVIRVKLALTEEEPMVKPYDQGAWAGLADSLSAPIEPSLALVEAMHARWVTLLRSLKPEDFGHTFRHPERQGLQSIDWVVGLYSWHGPHHIAHITNLRERMGW